MKRFTQIVKEQCWISRSSEGQGHDATCWWKGLDLSNIVCEYEVNRLTNEILIRGKHGYIPPAKFKHHVCNILASEQFYIISKWFSMNSL